MRVPYWVHTTVYPTGTVDELLDMAALAESRGWIREAHVYLAAALAEESSALYED